MESIYRKSIILAQAKTLKPEWALIQAIIYSFQGYSV